MLVLGGAIGSTRALSDCELYDPNDGTWEPADSLTTKRKEHTATLLPSGKVFVAAGRAAESSYLSSAEMFQPAVGTWDESPSSLVFGRAGSAATMLFPSGKLLVSGGIGVDQLLASAELYDPATRTWSETGSLNTPRSGHTSTLLPSGWVLVAGGSNINSEPLDSAELYDPENGTWQNTQPIPGARRWHTATLLPSGKVLVVSGYIQRSCYLYDPDAETWSETSPLTVGRERHTATLLPSGKVLITGGSALFSLLSNALLYDPDSENWTEVERLVYARTAHTATLLNDGRVLVTGGNGGSALSSAEIYNPDSQTWTLAGYLSSARHAHTATRLPSGEVLVAGGSDGALSIASAELYDSATGLWRAAPWLATARRLHIANLLPTGEVLVAGGRSGDSGGPEPSSVEIYRPDDCPSERRPTITAFSSTIGYGGTTTITGIGFRGDSEANSGNGRSSAVNYPLVQILEPVTGQISWLSPDPRSNFSDDPMTLTVTRYPPTLHPGWYFLSVSTTGLSSVAVPVEVECSLVITTHPTDQSAPVGSTAMFSVETQGGRVFQWQKNGIDIPGATDSFYTTPPVSAVDSGTTYRVLVDTGCMNAISAEATLTVLDDTPPAARVSYPSGGEYWLLSPEGSPDTKVISWEMSDNIRICHVEVSLLYSDNEGESYQPAPEGGGLPGEFPDGFPGGTCPHPGETTTSVEYTVPSAPPSGSPGSLYKIRVRVTDDAGLPTTVESENPFFIVKPNPDAVKTLILTNLDRMGTSSETEELDTELRDLADHPQVLGLLVDLGGNTALTQLYDAWDADASSPSPNPELANLVLFGCHGMPRPAGCPAGEETDGIHDIVHDRLQAYSGVEYLILVGDDRVIPMARVRDWTELFPEPRYTSNDPADPDAELSTGGTAVGQALEARFYLSDDPLAVLAQVQPEELVAEGKVFLPDLAVGRLVETPEEIIAAIATFKGEDGALDLTTFDPGRSPLLVTGYDFLLDSAKKIRSRWKNFLDPVAELLREAWDELDLLENLCLLAGLASLNGHATHYEEGVPGPSFFDIWGLDTAAIVAPEACGPGQPLDLRGRVIYAVGCHGGLPVAGSSVATDPELDLPQALMSRGVMAYIANSGYGWGLLYGIGYSERVVEIFSEEMTRGGTVVVGDAVKQTKLRYFLESPRFDVYSDKTLMQWTVFGFPMYAVRTGIPEHKEKAFTGLAPKAGERPAVEQLGSVSVARKLSGSVAGAEVDFKASLPPYLTQLNLRFDLSSTGVYTKYSASGDILDTSGCADPAGCYYTLNSLVERQTGSADLPLQPFLVYDSRLSGTSQHGVMWMGGAYDEETGWIPVFAELASNGGDGSNHGVGPRLIYPKPIGPCRRILGDQDDCRASDLDMSSVVLTTGELVQDSGGEYSIERLYREIDLEVFYFNNTQDVTENCDRTGPILGDGPHHQVDGRYVDWAVAPGDAAGVWRVVVVYNDEASHRWVPLELENEGGTWSSRVRIDGSGPLIYFLQAVDARGNVSWLEYEGLLPSSGVPLDIPDPVDAEIIPGISDLTLEVSHAPDPVMAGDPLTFTITVINLGPDSADSMEVRGQLPLDAVYEHAWGEEWSCTSSADTVRCSRDVLAPGTASVIRVLVAAPAAGGTLESKFNVSSQNDSNPLNNGVKHFILVVDTTMTDLAIVKEDGGAVVEEGQPITYSITVTNNGPHKVDEATVTDDFPPELIEISWTCESTVGSSCTSSGTGDILDTVSILPQGTLLYKATATVADGTTGPIESTATVSVPSGMEDFAPGNNTSTVRTGVLSGDVIFADGFESGDTSRWSPLEVKVEDEAPNDASRFVGRFSLDLRTLSVTEKRPLVVLATDASGEPLLALGLVRREGRFAVLGQLPAAGADPADTGFLDLGREPRVIELELERTETSAGTLFELRIDGVRRWRSEVVPGTQTRNPQRGELK
ncbi:MAG: DUF11 domain-containing protein [bacterium]|nr:DUF11 domain-containing protein [bacterium]